MAHHPGRATTSLFFARDPADGRWQRGAIARGLYLADCDGTAWAEWLRATAERGVPPSEALPRTVFRLDVDLEEIADLTDPAARATQGIPGLQPTRRQWPLTQPIGERL